MPSRACVFVCQNLNPRPPQVRLHNSPMPTTHTRQSKSKRICSKRRTGAGWRRATQHRWARIFTLEHWQLCIINFSLFFFKLGASLLAILFWAPRRSRNFFGLRIFFSWARSERVERRGASGIHGCRGVPRPLASARRRGGEAPRKKDKAPLWA
jgi:hypothetical protein